MKACPPAFSKILLAASLAALVWLGGCAAKPVVANPPLSTANTAQTQSSAQAIEKQNLRDTTVVLAFSGGGTRAAALSYGVLQALRDTPMPQGKGKRMLDEIDAISAVSGGSFTAAYYALKGDALFSEFEPKFLKRDIEGELKSGIFSLTHLFSRESRSGRAMRIYDKRLFHGARFSDLPRGRAPLLIINASDLGQGARFSYTQEYFDLLCSDLSAMPLSHAVTASSAVPLVFSPVLLKNYTGCQTQTAREIEQLAKKKDLPAPVAHNLAALQKYIRDDGQANYLHLIDGGITDNLGLRALYDLIAAHGGPETFWQRIGKRPPKRFVIISVDGMRSSDQNIDATPEAPSIIQTVQAVTDTQMDRYSADTLNLIGESAKDWVRIWSGQGSPVELYFMHLHFRQVEDARLRDALFLIPTALTLPPQQVDELIATGRNLLRSHPEFKRLLKDLGASNAAVKSATEAPMPVNTKP